MDKVEILLKEYETLRAEILTAMNSRSSILSFGIAAVGAVFSASIAVSAVTSSTLLSAFMLMGAVPAMNCFVLYIWLGEYQRMQRAGKFIADIETRINTKVGEDILSWETHLRKNQKHMKYPYHTTVVLLTLISFISVGVGLFFFDLSLGYKMIIAVIILVFLLLIYYDVISRMAKLRI